MAKKKAVKKTVTKATLPEPVYKDPFTVAVEAVVENMLEGLEVRLQDEIDGAIREISGHTHRLPEGETEEADI